MKIYIVEWLNKETGEWEPSGSSSNFMEDELDMARQAAEDDNTYHHTEKFRVATYTRTDP
jgi:hypothetical protein